MIGSDAFKVIKRLQNMDNWYSIDDYDTLYNSEYGDTAIKRDRDYNLKVDIIEGNVETDTWVMDFPYLFTSIFNWSMGKVDTGRRAKWDIFLNGRQLDISIYGVQATRQTYYHIEPRTYWDNELGIHLNTTDSIPYYAYIRTGVDYLAYKLFFSMQCYRDDQKALDKALTVIPVFESEQERIDFIDYIKRNSGSFLSAVNTIKIDEMFPTYSKNVDSVIVYKLGKTLVQWLDKWRI